jgi:diguanylate cyclase (GGDEF)-like protein
MIDLRTLLAVMLVSDLLLAALLWVGVGRRLRDDVALWSFALFAQATAFGLFAVTGRPQPASIVMGATLLGLSFTLQAAALLSFDSAGASQPRDKRHLPVWVHTAVIAGIAPPFALIIGDPGAATLFGGIVFGTLLLMLAGIAMQLHSPATAQARSVMVVAFALAALAFYIRGVSAGLSAEPTRAFLQPSFFESGLYLAGFAAVVASTFGFVMLRKDREDATARVQASIDALTGACTRAVFREIAEREFSRARRAGQPLSLLLVDVDHFQAASERYGAAFADSTLKRLADIVRGALRKEDMIVRYAVDQLLVVLPDIPGPGAVVVAGRIRREIEEEAFEAGDQRVAITVSIGVAARLDEGPESVDTLLARAADALALAQKRGRNRVVALSLGRSIAA